ncbi:PaaX family transcriptional regulator [Phytomonospora endophytica]|uniref:Phenylacetic acid degradation operon negative regulatory protein n=1 Tax=Phytomonospora endophytica TaxID=714109 RepID=A0A841FCS7_9ACTN|nr:PaaX family transcriptional regulator C-terminal domain-containing protein [Phytomonospora endophytica]MBB6033215.1 phenylacetic acid degradation operon negative regulatory protein [Phytomonospora endophytica]GIG65442.1 PaaX family transcriptional regulator [Phytomonospora endophytica]
MRARSALFDLYGDYLRNRGGAAPIAALVRLLAPLDIAAPAVRTAVSRMMRQDWLTATRLGRQRGYALTGRAVRRLDSAAGRIYRTNRREWDGGFDLLVVEPPADRSTRARLAAQLQLFGYGHLGGSTSTWVSPWHADEVGPLLTETGVAFERFDARHAGDPVALVRRAWDLRELELAYEKFIDELEPVVGGVGPTSSAEAAYAARFRLVHAFRAFLFRDPQLPSALLPEGWAGSAAAAFFDAQAARLRPAADRHVDRMLSETI